MVYRLLSSIVLGVLLTISVSAQVQQGSMRSAEQRALTFEPYFSESARRYGIDVRILRTICFIESRFQLHALSPKGARGPMQFMPETARRYKLKNRDDPKAAIDAAAHYLHDLLVKFGGRLDLALAAYNAGEGTVESFRTGKPLILSSGHVINSRGLMTDGVPPYPETQDYVRSVIAHLTEPRTPKTSSSYYASSPGRSNAGFENRDFILDAFSDGGQKISSSQKTSSAFIDIP